MSKVTVVLGAQWGDEGKGKLVDILAKDYPVIGRATGGANAGHTVVVGDKKHVFHLLPSGLLNEGTVCMIGNGVVVHLETMFEELRKLAEGGITWEGRLTLSDRATILFDYHKVIDGMQEASKGSKQVGTTKRGIGPCYSEKISRHAMRMCDFEDMKMFEEKYRENVARAEEMYDFKYEDADDELEWHIKMAPEILKMLRPVSVDINKAIKDGQDVLIEGANGFMLDIDHGTYPYVTSSNSSIGGICTGLGIPPRSLSEVIGIVKAYTTRVGAGPFATELHDALGDQIRNNGGEFGSTTGRPRRCGWLDLVQMEYSARVNGLGSINITKLDVLTGVPIIKVCTSYKVDGVKVDYYPTRLADLEKVEPVYQEFAGWTEDISQAQSFPDLPENAQNYVKFIEDTLQVKVSSIGVGPKRDQMIML
ncbi:MAG: adenylosuccinate synthase [Candidatus Peregrinibacteria bacterium]|nr:adenylosuccinate synthase [Candidatus Peregrinibacteria bacterium]MDZ4245105.1 adenylosuccinate synthase [Candidatus Gracilibacteria bacterium]